MAMLAGPRQKQKVINLRAKNSAWSNDSNKFGQKMLEKMGWSEGKGLGAKENGIVEHVIARYKNDEKGLGYEDRNDQWTKHEDDFNALLANLSNGSESNEIVLHSGTSLEKKSKKSKARVHYHKFTRGKDISRYSEKELANIFGKKSFKDEEPKEEVIEQIKITEQVFTEGGNMNDYFKSKMSSIKGFSQKNLSNDDYSDKDCGFKGFSGTGVEDEENSHLGFGCQSFSYTEETTIVDSTQEKVPKKKKRKHKISITVEENNINVVESIEEVPVKSKKKNKKKSELLDLESPVVSITETLQETEIPSKKKKKKKRDVENQDDCVILQENSNEINNKKTKKHSTDLCSSEFNDEHIDEKTQDTNCFTLEELEIPLKSKVKRNKKCKEYSLEELSNNNIVEQENVKDTDVYVPKKKKKRKN